MASTYQYAPKCKICPCCRRTPTATRFFVGWVASKPRLRAVSESRRNAGGRHAASAHQGRAGLGGAGGRTSGGIHAVMIAPVKPCVEDSFMAPLHARRLRIHTDHESVVFLRSDSPVCRAEGLSTQARVTVRSGAGEIIV